ncbi:MAG: alginate export family protein, partial [Gemmatimonadota bacterium]
MARYISPGQEPGNVSRRMPYVMAPVILAARSIRRSVLLVAAVAALATPLTAQAPAPGPANGAPRLRLSPDGRSYVTFGGQLRERIEGWRGFNFGAPDSATHDDVFALTRVRLSADLRMGGTVRMFAEAKSAFATNRRLAGGKRLADVDELDLHQGFLELSGRMLRRSGATTARIGRQELSFGRERLVSPLDWSNVRRSFDGIAVTRTRGPMTVTSFLTRPVQQDKYRFNPWDEHRAFYGVYGTAATARGDRRMDVYWLGLTQDAAVFNGTSGSEGRHTLGLRFSGGGPRQLGDYDLEAAYQFGSLGGASISAWMVSALAGRRLSVAASAPRLWLGFDFASGDGESGGAVGTFNQLFPLGHAYFGYVDLVGRQNIVDASGGVSWPVVPPFVLTVDGHRFWRASAADAMYRADGAVVRAGTPGSSRDLGTELDVLLRY